MEILVKIASRGKVLLWHLCRAFLIREHLSVVGVRRTEGRVSATASQSLGVAQRPHKVKDCWLNPSHQGPRLQR
jgi:hypothetical protein